MLGAFAASHPVMVELAKFGVISAGFGCGEQLVRWGLQACGIKFEDPKEVSRRKKVKKEKQFAMNEIAALSTMLTAQYGPNWMGNKKARALYENRSRELSRF